MLNGWRLPLRLAFRDMRRYKGRSALASLLIFLPMFIISAAICGVSTWYVSGSERASLILSHATGQIFINSDSTPGAKPLPTMTKPASTKNLPTPAALNAVGHGTSAVYAAGAATVKQNGGTYPVQYASFTGDAKVASGWLPIVTGHTPTNNDEIVVTTSGKQKGIPTQGQLVLTDKAGGAHKVKVVGTVSDTLNVDVLGKQSINDPTPGWGARERATGN